MCVCVSGGGMGVGVYDVHKCVLTHMVRRIFYKYIIQCVSVFGVEFSLLLQFFSSSPIQCSAPFHEYWYNFLLHTHTRYTDAKY